MTSIEILPLIALVAMFVIATLFPINIGILGFIGAFVVGYFALGFDDKEILDEFPSSIVLTIVGVTYFFGMAKRNGTIDLLVNSCIRAVHGRVTVVPWVFFFVASVLTALGTFSPAAVALIVPAAMAFAARTGMSPLVMGIMVINGAHAGAFSPISVSGVLVRDIVESNGLALDPWTLFFASYGINLLLSVMTVVGYAALARVKGFEYTATGSTAPAPGSSSVGGSPVRTPVPTGGGSAAVVPQVVAPKCSSARQRPRWSTPRSRSRSSRSSRSSSSVHSWCSFSRCTCRSASSPSQPEQSWRSRI